MEKINREIEGNIYQNPKTDVKYVVVAVSNTEAEENKKDRYPTTVIYTDLGHNKLWTVSAEVWLEKGFNLVYTKGNKPKEDSKVMSYVESFMALGDQEINYVPTLVDKKTAEFRVDLIDSENKELKKAIEEDDILEVFDALLDLQYVLDGAFHTFGMYAIKKEGFEAVHNSNMSKFCLSEEEALKTVEKYEKEGIKTFFEKKETQVTADVPAITYFVVYRASDKKILKSVDYLSVSNDLKVLLDREKQK